MRDIQAIYNLANCYEYGFIKKDLSIVFILFVSICEKHNKTIYELGVCYYYGIGPYVYVCKSKSELF